MVALYTAALFCSPPASLASELQWSCTQIREREIEGYVYIVYTHVYLSIDLSMIVCVCLRKGWKNRMTFVKVIRFLVHTFVIYLWALYKNFTI